jgi:type IV secretory pathway VirB2 component (pilin)
MINMKKIFLTFLTLSILPLTTKAAGLVPCGGPNEDPCKLCHLFLMFTDIVGFVMVTLVPPIAVLMLVVAGFNLFIKGTGDPAEMKKGQKAMMTIVIGLVLIYGSWIIVNTLLSASGLVAWEGLKEGGWNVIGCGI